MAGFDMGDYLQRRFSTVGSDKISELQQASQEKIQGLREHAARLEIDKEANKDAWVNQLNLNPDNGLGYVVDSAASAVSGGVRDLIGKPLAMIPNALAYSDEMTLTQEHQDAGLRYRNGTATAKDMALLNSKLAPVSINESPAVRAQAQAMVDAKPDAPTVLDVLNRSQNLRQAASDIVKRTDLSHFTDQSSRQKFTQQLEGGFDKPWSKVNEGWDAMTRGEDGQGLSDIASGFGSLLLNAGKSVADNPAAASKWAAENAPQLLVGAFGKIGQGLMTASNLGYGADIYNQGIEAYQAQNGGAFPPESVRKDIAIHAAKATIYEHVGDHIGLGLTHLVGDTAKAAVRTGFKESIKNSFKAGAEGLVTEAGTEGAQQYEEGAATFKPTSAKEIYSAAVIGGVSGGMLSGGGRAVAEITKSTPEHLQKKLDQFNATEEFVKAAKTGDISKFADPKGDQYDPTKAIAVLFANSQQEGTTPETKHTNLEKANQVIASLEEKRSGLMEMSDSALAENKQLLIEQQAALDTATTPEAVDRAKSMVAMLESTIAATDNQSPEVKQGNIDEIAKIDQHLESAKIVADQLTKLVKPKTGDIASVVDTVNAPTTAVVADKQAAVDRLMQVAMAHPDDLPDLSLKALVDNQANGLTTDQRDHLRSISEARKAENRLKGLKGVSQEVMNGDASKNQLGIKDFKEMMSNALLGGSQKLADNTMKLLTRFADNHFDKATLFNQLYDKARADNKSFQVVPTPNGGWAEAKQSYSPAELEAVGGITIHANSGKLIHAIRVEAKALQSAKAMQSVAYQAKFGKAYTASTVNSNSQVTSGNSVKPSTAQSTSNQSTKVVGADTSVDTKAQSTKRTDTDTQSVIDEMQPYFKDRTFRTLSETEVGLLDKALAQLQSVFGDQIKGIKGFMVQEGYKSDGSYFNGFRAIAINPDVFTDESRLLQTVTHELSHARDRNNGTMVKGTHVYDSERTDVLNPEGAVFEEVKSAVLADVKGELATSWLGYIFNPNKGEELTTSQVSRELYAQLVTLYFTNPELMNAIPQAFKIIDESFNAQHQNQEGMEEGKSLPVRERATGQSGQSTTEPSSGSEQSNGEPRHAGLEGKLSVFQQASDYAGQKLGDLVDGLKGKTTVFQKMNLVQAWLTQSLGSQEDTKVRPLVAVTDFLNAWSEGKIKPEDYLGSVKPNDKQLAVLDHFVAKALSLMPVIESNLVKGRINQGKKGGKEFNENTSEYDFNNPAQYLIDLKDGKAVMDGNAKTAIAVAIYTWIQENAGNPSRNTPEDVKAMFGMPEYEQFRSDALYQEVHDKGTMEKVVLNALGQRITQALGLKENDEATADFLPKLQSSLGALAVKVMLDEGILERNPVAGSIIAESLPLSRAAKTTEATQGFLRLARNEGKTYQERTLKPVAAGIAEVSKGTQGIVTKLFGVEATLIEPSWEPSTVIQKLTKNTNQLVPKLLNKILGQQAEVPNHLRKDMWALFNVMDRESFLAMAGKKEINEATMSVVNIAGIEAQNDALEREYDRANEYFTLLGDTSPLGLDQPMFFQSSVWKQQRVGLLTNMINPQTSKMQRSMLYKPEWETQVTSTDKAMMENFRLRVAEGLGIKTDKQDNAASIEQITALLSPKSKDEKVIALRNAISVLQKAIKAEETLSVEDQKAIQEGVAAAGEKMHSLDALVAMAHYENAKAEAKSNNKRKFTFTVQMMGEVDGVTNGPMLSHLMLGAATNPEELYSLLNKGGFFRDSDGFDAYNVYRGTPGHKDLYETTIGHVLDSIHAAFDSSERMQPVLSAMWAVTGPLENKERTKIEKAGRNIIKTPLTAMVFGSAIDGAIHSMFTNFVGSIYDGFEGIAKAKPEEQEAKRVAFIAHVNTLLEFGRADKLLSKNMTVSELLQHDFTKNKDQLRALEETFNATLGNAVAITMNEDFGQFMDTRKRINTTAQATFAIYDAGYQAIRNSFIQELIESGELPFFMSEGKKVSRTDLNKGQQKRLDAKVKALNPVLHTYMSKHSNQLDAGLHMSKSARKLSQEATYQGQAWFAKRMPGTNDAMSMRTAAYQRILTAPGVAMLPMMMHSLDSAISHMAAMGTQVLNIHDAHGTGLQHFTRTAQNLNQATWKAVIGYSPAAEMRDAFTRTVIAMDALLQTGENKQEVIEGLKEVLVAFAKKESSEEDTVTSQDVLLRMATAMSTTAYQSDKVKLETLAQMAYIDQYALQGGRYEVTAEDKASAQEQLKALKNGVSPELRMAIQRISKAVAQSKAPQTKKGMQQLETDDMPSHTGTGNQTSNPGNQLATLDIHEALNDHSISPSFDEHLRGLLSVIVNKLHGPYGSLLALHEQNILLTPIGLWNKAKSSMEAPFASKILASGLNISEQQAFAIEQIEVTARAAMNTQSDRKDAPYNALVKLFLEMKGNQQLKTNLDPAVWDFIFNLEGGQGDKLDYLSRFVAMGLGHESFNDQLKIATEKKEKTSDTSFTARLENWFERALEWVNGKLTNIKPGEKADERMSHLLNQLVGIEAKRKAMLLDTGESLMAPLDNVLKKGVKGVRGSIEKFGRSDTFQNNKHILIQASGTALSAIAGKRVDAISEHLMRLKDTLSGSRQDIVSGLINEIRGANDGNMPFHTLIRETKRREGEREKIRSDISRVVLESFDEEGTYLTKEAKAAISAVMMRTDMQVLMNHFDLSDIHKMLSDDRVLKANIKTLEASLNQFTGLSHYYIAASKILGYSMATGSVKGQLMRNAHNIAKLYDAPANQKVTSAQVELATPIIDQLITLYAIQHSDATHKSEAIKVMDREMLRGDESGVEMVLRMHQNLQEQSKEKLFEGSEALMTKGYTPELYNPHREVLIANVLKGKELEEQGYTKKEPVAVDPRDPNKEQRHVYVRDGGGLRSFLTGIFSYTGKNAKGSRNATDTVKDVNDWVANQQDMQRMHQARQADVARMFRPNPGFDPSKVAHTYAAPVLNAKGQVVEYRYLMQEANKDSLLDRDNRFDTILGSFASNIYDKESTKEMNHQAVEALHAQYLHDYAKMPKSYVRVSPMSTDPKMREIYDMMPDDTKKSIQEIWGEDGMMVRKDLLDINFGYRKSSVTDAFAMDEKERNFLERVIVDFATYTMGGKAEIKLRKVEDIWQELVHETKDILVIKNVSTLLGNIGSNVSLLFWHGIPLKDMVHYHHVALRGAIAYRVDSKELADLEIKVKTGMSKSQTSDMEQKILVLKDRISRNPVKELLDAGLMPSIVEDVDPENDLYSYKTRLLQTVEAKTSWVNKHVVTAARTVYMAKEGKIYQALHHATQLSDFVARYALYQHVTTRKESPMSKTEAIQLASDAFINYDVPSHRTVQYMNDMGGVWFTKYYLRIQKTISHLYADQPARALMLIALKHYFHNAPILMDSGFMHKFDHNPFSVGAFKLPGTLSELGTVKVALSPFN